MTIPAALHKCEVRPGADPQHISDVEAAIGTSLPPDYRLLLQETNGFEGFVDANDEVFLSFWSVADIPELNGAYSVGEFLPGVVLLGTDGGDTGYGFTTRNGHIEYVAVPLIGMAPEALERIGRSFADVLDRLAG